MIFRAPNRRIVHSRALLIGCGLALTLACAPDAPATAPENAESTDNSESTRPISSPDRSTAETAAIVAESAESKLAPLRAAVKKNPQSAQAIRALARELHDLNFKEESAAQFERLLEIDPSPRTLLELGLAYTGAGRFDDAIRTYEKRLESIPNDPITLHNLGSIAYRRDDFAAAADYYRRAIDAKPDYLLAHCRLGDSLKAVENYREAYRAYEAVLNLEPRNANEAEEYVNAMYELASLDLMMGAYQRAGQFLTEVLRVAPEHRSAYYAYGQVLLQLGQPELAQQALDRHAELLEKRQAEGAAAGGE